MSLPQESRPRDADDPDDIVRLEIEAALTRGVRIIPVLVEGTVMPTRHELPESLVSLARRNALRIRHDSFRSDAGRLVTAIERILAPTPVTAARSTPDAYGIRSAGNALGEVAQQDSGPARIDSGRATWLLTEAERVANSLTDENAKAWAMRNIAAALAVPSS